MTAEERFDRIEHVTAGLVEERRKDREEFRQLWRDNQRQINELGIRITELGLRITEVDEHLGQRIGELAEESRAADKRLEARIDHLGAELGGRINSLVSAIGTLVIAMPRPQAE